MTGKLPGTGPSVVHMTITEEKVEAYRNGELVGSYTRPPALRPRRVRAVRPGHPEKFAGPKLKLARAKKHIAELEASIIAFQEGQPYEIVEYVDSATGEKLATALLKEPIPTDFSAIIGDAVHNLRAALDYLVCDLIRAKGEGDGQHGSFPLEARARRQKPGAVRKISGAVSDKAEKLIIRLKGSQAWNTPIWALHMLDIFDKHNCIVTVAAATTEIIAQVGVPVMFQGPDGELRLLGPGPGGRPMLAPGGTPANFKSVALLLNEEVEIHRAPAGFHEEADVSISIAFGKPDFGKTLVEGEPVFETLREFADLVERTIEIMERHAL